MAQKVTAVEWLYHQYVKHNGNISEILLRMAFTKEREQMSDSYTEGFKRKAYISELMKPVPEWNEGVPEDFDTYYENTYGE
jgi:hypothetical protein